jgi:hypothetical protein
MRLSHTTIVISAIAVGIAAFGMSTQQAQAGGYGYAYSSGYCYSGGYSCYRAPVVIRPPCYVPPPVVVYPRCYAPRYEYRPPIDFYRAAPRHYRQRSGFSFNFGYWR